MMASCATPMKRRMSVSESMTAMDIRLTRSRSTIRPSSQLTLGWNRSARTLGGLLHQDSYNRAGEKRQCRDRCDRPGEAEAIGDETCGECADRVAEIAPEPIDAERAGAPGWMRGVGNRRDQAWIDHRRSKAEKKTADEPPLEPTCSRGEKQAAGLDPH